MGADSWEALFVTLYSLTLPTICRFCYIGLDLGPRAAGGVLFSSALVLLLIQLLLTAHYVRHVLILQGRIPQWCESDTLNHRRLERRLCYLVGKYAPHAPHWQFVLWSRQLALAAISVMAYDVRSQALWALAVVLVILVAHGCTRPYAMQYQNRLEVALAGGNATLILIGYFSFHQGSLHGPSRRSEKWLSELLMWLVVVLPPAPFMVVGLYTTLARWVLVVSRREPPPAPEGEGPLVRVNVNSQ